MCFYRFAEQKISRLFQFTPRPKDNSLNFRKCAPDANSGARRPRMKQVLGLRQPRKRVGFDIESAKDWKKAGMLTKTDVSKTMRSPFTWQLGRSQCCFLLYRLVLYLVWDINKKCVMFLRMCIYGLSSSNYMYSIDIRIYFKNVANRLVNRHN